MEESSILLIFFLHLIPILFRAEFTKALEPTCRTKCGPLDIKYPFGTGQGCGSPRFHPYVTCSPETNQLLLTTHTGYYPITAISYETNTITITPPSMSTCTSMHHHHPSATPTLGLDWQSPFQLGPSTFILLSCTPPTSSFTINHAPICDPTTTPYLCASIYSCPAVVDLGLPLFPATNTCCVYSPANLDGNDELNLDSCGMNCGGYASVVSLGEAPTNPSRWEYGVALKYTVGGLDSYHIAPACHACELSNGICGYAPPSNYFVCVCKSGYNTSNDCGSYNNVEQDFFLGSTSGLLNVAIWPRVSSIIVFVFIRFIHL